MAETTFLYALLENLPANQPDKFLIHLMDCFPNQLPLTTHCGED